MNGELLARPRHKLEAQPTILPKRSLSTVKLGNALAGQSGAAARAMAQVRRLDPALCLANLKELYPIKRLDDYAKWEEGLRLAGLPE